MGDEENGARGAGSPLWVPLKAGDITYKIVNFDAKDENGNYIYAPKTGIVELVPMKRVKRHDNILRTYASLDPDHDFFYGIPNGVDRKTGAVRWQAVLVGDFLTINLAKPEERKRWIVLKNSAFVAGSPNLIGKPKYKVYDKEAEANKYIAERVPKRNAVVRAEALFGSDLIEIGRNLGFAVDHMSQTQLHAEVIKSAEENYKRFNEVFDSPLRVQTSVLNRAIATGVVHTDPITGYMYGGMTLGITEGNAIEYLKVNMNICQTIDTLSKGKESDTIKAMEAKAPKTKSSTDAKDAELQIQAKRIADLEKQLQESHHKNLNEVAEMTVEKLAAQTDPEFAALLQEAKDLKVKSPHLFKDKELLRKAIDAKKSEAQN